MSLVDVIWVDFCQAWLLRTQNLSPQQSEGNLPPEPAQEDGERKILPGGEFVRQRR